MAESQDDLEKILQIAEELICIMDNEKIEKTILEDCIREWQKIVEIREFQKIQTKNIIQGTCGHIMIVSLYSPSLKSDCCLTPNVQYFSYTNFMSLVLPNRGLNPLFEASTKLIIYTINAVNVV